MTRVYSLQEKISKTANTFGRTLRAFAGRAFSATISVLTISVLSIAALSYSAMAQSGQRASFSPIKFVNNQAITGYELGQRIAFLELLGFDGDVRSEALSGLVDDRLRNSVARQLGLSLSAEMVTTGMDEFAARGNLSTDEFLQALAQRGVAPETFRDFVGAGIVWREVIKAKYNDSINISDAAIDRALSNLAVSDAQSVSLAEIVLDAAGGRRNEALALARDLQIDFIKGRSFTDAARAVSIGATARSGGALGAQLLSQLPTDVAVLVRGLGDGQISPPIILKDRLYIYQMVQNGRQPIVQTGAKVIGYAEISLTGNDAQSAIATLRSNVDDCDDLYAYGAKNGLSVQRRSGASAGVSGVLQSLDAGEISGPVNGGAGPMAVMLCARGLDPMQTASRDEVRLMLKNQRLSALADIYLSELRSDALIRDP